jgi:hypothetical protein
MSEAIVAEDVKNHVAIPSGRQILPLAWTVAGKPADKLMCVEGADLVLALGCGPTAVVFRLAIAIGNRCCRLP